MAAGRRSLKRLGPRGALPALALLAAVLVWAAAASGSTTYDLRGTWPEKTVFAGTTYTGYDVVQTMDLTTGAFSGGGAATGSVSSTGVPTDTSYTWSLKGTVTGNRVTWIEGPYHGYTPPYTDTCTGTIAAGGNSITGTCTAPGQSGVVWTAVRLSTSTGAAAEPIAAAPTKGTVYVELPGSTKFEQLTGAANVPPGATVNVASGWIRLGTGAKSAQFYKGEFLFGRTPSGGARLTLNGGAPCPTAGARAAGASTKPLRKEKLWGTGHGNFTTVGKFASASVIGTHWLTWNTCSGTEIRVASGHVRVTDLVKHTSFVLSAPYTYTAHG